jgi:Ser/Thr protein kinase RdoA (MazF antagonist)
MDGPQAPNEATLEQLGLSGASLTPLKSGLINKTWLAELADGERRIVQILNRMFPPAINGDIDAVTRRLAERGLVTPRLVPTVDGALWLEQGGAVWRQLSYVPGETVERVPSAAHAREAGALLGRFHDALADFEYEFANARLGVHDLDGHVAALAAALEAHAEHREFAAIESVAAEILELRAQLPSLPEMPDRNVHGDPKISNIVFDVAAPRAVCLIDLDTLARMPVTLELGDALRSWCNAGDEDATDARFDATLFAAAIEGYAATSRAFIDEAEWRGFAAATLRIAVELAARFCADALAESYFGWDAERYTSASAHNLARARGQLALARDIARQREALQTEVERAFAV